MFIILFTFLFVLLWGLIDMCKNTISKINLLNIYKLLKNNNDNDNDDNNNDKNFKNNNGIKLIIFDLDNTLVDALGPFEEVENILKYIKSKNIKLAIASYNPEPETVLKHYGLINYFDTIEGDIKVKDENGKFIYDRNKFRHISNILRYYKNKNLKLKSNEILFYDDLTSNTDYVEKKFGIKSIWVEPEIGIQMEQVTDIIG